MSATGRDWGVTANQEIDRCVDTFEYARVADLTQLEVLRTCWTARQAADAAVGAMAESLLHDGVEMATIAAVLGFASTVDATNALAPLRAAADVRLHRRLHDA
jgi:hypothetical protein